MTATQTTHSSVKTFQIKSGKVLSAALAIALALLAGTTEPTTGLTSGANLVALAAE